jgi:hypothetical protein
MSCSPAHAASGDCVVLLYACHVALINVCGAASAMLLNKEYLA